MPESTERPIYVYDGACVLCSRFVRFLLRHESSDILRFASIQSAIGRHLLEKAGVNPDDPETVILIDAKGRTHYRARAICLTFGFLKAPWRWLSIGALLPATITDPLYAVIARNRYRWFGTHTVCSPEGVAQDRVLP